MTDNSLRSYLKIMIIRQVEKHIIKKSHPYYNMLCEFTHWSKNLYNHANYLVRKEFLETGHWLRYQDLDKLLRQDLDYPDYINMPTAQSAQQTLRKDEHIEVYL